MIIDSSSIGLLIASKKFLATLFSLYIIVDFNRLFYMDDLNINDWNTAFYMSYTIYLDIINLLLQILEAMSNS